MYKDSGEKVTLSKKELENRIGDGGRVIDRQVDYMEYVNRQIFGFETTEEYKEMIDLLSAFTQLFLLFFLLCPCIFQF